MQLIPSHMNYFLVEMWHLFQQQSSSVIIDALKNPNLLPLSPPDHDTNTQACLVATQTPPGKKSEETEDISRASMTPGQVKAISTTDPMVILREKGESSWNLLIRVAAYDIVQ